jgi:hypothetical protein
MALKSDDLNQIYFVSAFGCAADDNLDGFAKDTQPSPPVRLSRQTSGDTRLKTVSMAIAIRWDVLN